jgi:hypothetical protein
MSQIKELRDLGEGEKVYAIARAASVQIWTLWCRMFPLRVSSSSVMKYRVATMVIPCKTYENSPQIERYRPHPADPTDGLGNRRSIHLSYSPSDRQFLRTFLVLNFVPYFVP